MSNTDTSILIPTPNEQERIRLIYFQTWPFNRDRHDYAYTCGVAEYDDFVDIKNILEVVGQKVWYKEISI